MSIHIDDEVRTIMANELERVGNNSWSPVGAGLKNAVNSIANTAGISELEILRNENNSLTKAMIRISTICLGPDAIGIMEAEGIYINEEDKENLYKEALKLSNSSNVKNECSRLILDAK
jgi:hypothetical protein